MELSQYYYDIVYHQGKINVVSDALSQVYCAATTVNALYRINASLCHPGITRMYHHHIQQRNLPYSLGNVEKMTSACAICCEIKPKFFKLPIVNLFKSSQPFERFSMDFKGPLPSKTKNHYIFTVVDVDEFSQFFFVFICKDTSSCTVISCLRSLFSLFGFPAIVHSDNAKCFIPNRLHTLPYAVQENILPLCTVIYLLKQTGLLNTCTINLS